MTKFILGLRVCASFVLHRMVKQLNRVLVRQSLAQFQNLSSFVYVPG